MKYDIFINGAIGWPISYDYVRSELKKCGDGPVSVYISSLGGALDHALKIRQLFVDHGNVTAYIHGFTASAATIISTGCKRVLMGRHAMYLAHRCSNWVDTWGQMNAEDLGRAIKELQEGQRDLLKIDQTLASIYATRTGRTVQEFADIMTKAEWLNADEVLALGLADGLAEDEADATAAAGSTEARAATFAACGLPMPPSAPRSTPKNLPTSMALPDNTPAAPAASTNPIFAFIDRIVAKLDAYFGVPAASTEDAPSLSTEDTGHTEATPTAAADTPADAPAPSTEDTENTEATPTAAAEAPADAPPAEGAEPAPSQAAEDAATIEALRAEVDKLRAQVATLLRQDGDISDRLADAPEDDAETERSRPARLRNAAQRYRYL